MKIYYDKDIDRVVIDGTGTLIISDKGLTVNMDKLEDGYYIRNLTYVSHSKSKLKTLVKIIKWMFFSRR